MLNLHELTSSPETLKQLLKRCRGLRSALLLSPEEAELAVSARGLSLPAGWAIQTVLNADEVDDLHRYKASSASYARVTVQDWLPNLPCLSLDVSCERHHFQWILPFWEAGARQWLEALAAQGSITLFADASDGTRSIAIVNRAPLSNEFDGVLSSIVAPCFDSKQASLDAMAVSGLRAMLERDSHFDDPHRKLRTMVVARTGNAQTIVDAFQMAADIGEAMLKTRDTKSAYH
ncbi:hypothetical protein [Hydrogenophaga atypica]|uniref:Uncharacterized protein n=1 Tax=Hydrogenophaga atypica TaxID=249409 RepID=A0ABW2QMU6_9BURK